MADDTTTLVRRELPHMLPVVAFFELMSDPPDVDWALCDPRAFVTGTSLDTERASKSVSSADGR